LFEELGAKVPSTSTGPVKEFFGTRGWVTRFRTRNGLHSVVRHGETAIGDRDTADKHYEKCKKIIEEGGFVSRQVFNCDKTGLSWKRMPRRKYIMKEETTLPGHKPIEEQLSLLFCANALGDCKVKPHCSCTIWRAPELLKTSEKIVMEFCGVPATRLG
jgi:hypothetical protein